MDILAEIGLALGEIRKQRPLIHHITNFVSMNDCANITLAIGASPTMTDAVEEVVEMAMASKALVLNLGTLQQNRLEAMLCAGKAANEKGIPVIFDPVGAGGTSFRTAAALEIMRQVSVSIVRGNLSEVTALAAKKSGMNPGVDNHASEMMSSDLVTKLAFMIGTTVVITGPIDAVSNGSRAILLGNGSSMLPYVTGTGCMTTSLIASFAAVTTPLVAAVGGVIVMGLAGEYASSQGGNKGPGTFHQFVLDGVFQMTPQLLKLKGKVLTDNE